LALNAMADSATPRPAYTKVTRSHKGVDAEARRTERRHRLLEAGLETLGAKGYHATTVRDICGGAGLSERYFYESFSGLPELFDTIYKQLHQDLLGRLMLILISSRSTQAPPMETARSALTEWLSFLKQDPRRARIMLIDAMGVNEGIHRSTQNASRDYMGAIQAFLDLLYPRLHEQQLSSRMMAATLSGACIHSAKEWTWSGFEASQDWVASHVMVVFESLDKHYKDVLASTPDGASSAP
jgi:AcrR family transcriptional regulator